MKKEPNQSSQRNAMAQPFFCFRESLIAWLTCSVRQFMKMKIILSLYLASAALLSAGTVIESAGTFAPFDRCKVQVQLPDKDSIEYKISCACKGIWVTTGPEKPAHVQDHWFLYAEADTRVWFFDGKESLILYQIGYFGGGAYAVGRTDDWLLDQIPEDVAVRLPKELIDKIEMEKKRPNQPSQRNAMARPVSVFESRSSRG